MSVTKEEMLKFFDTKLLAHTGNLLHDATANDYEKFECMRYAIRNLIEKVFEWRGRIEKADMVNWLGEDALNVIEEIRDFGKGAK